jgi:8-oxo-dGTP pyrophosphatase MutT (NUDIX family)
MDKTIPIKERVVTQPFVVVGMIIKKEGEFLLVQEAKKEPGKWNQPAGWLDLKEDIIEGARREAFEETGLKIELLGLLGIYPLLKVTNGVLRYPIKIIFAAKALDNNIKFNKEELLDAKWFSLEEIKSLGENLRDLDIINEVEDYLAGKIYPLSVIKPITDMTKGK